MCDFDSRFLVRRVQFCFWFFGVWLFIIVHGQSENSIQILMEDCSAFQQRDINKWKQNNKLHVNIDGHGILPKVSWYKNGQT